MSNHQTMSKKTKPLFRGLVAIAVISMGSIAMVGVKAADPPAAADLSPDLVTNHCVWVTCGTGTCCFRPPH